MVLPILSLVVVSFVLSFLGTLAMKHVAPRIGFVDKPGHRKIHHNPKPLGGGVAIFWAFALPMIAVLLAAAAIRPEALPNDTAVNDSYKGVVISHYYPGASDTLRAYWGGVRRQAPLAWAILGATFVMHVMGIVDDKRNLGPYGKLIIQLGVTTALVWGLDLRAGTALGIFPSIVLTVLWITAICNAFNFLDNMDGLSAGIACVASIAFLITTLSIGQWFVAAGLALLIGALLGFLCFNFNPASIFMGDSGSLVIGFLLGVLTVRTTFLPPGAPPSHFWYAMFAPVVVLAVPLYDLIVVSAIRLSRGKSPFVGDTNHFSHRLVARGMSRRTAVLCLYLITAATSVAAILLPQVAGTFGAILILVQTILILGVVFLLEQHPLPSMERE